MQIVQCYAMQAKITPIKNAVVFTMTCYERNCKRDVNNVCSGASKIILDFSSYGLLSIKKTTRPKPYGLFYITKVKL